MPSRPANIVRFTAKPEGADQFASLLERLLAPVEDEQGTRLWFTARSEDDPTSFVIADVFSDLEARKVHFEGVAAALLRSEAPPLLAGAPEIIALQALASKNL